MNIGDTVQYTRAFMRELTPYIDDQRGEIIRLGPGDKAVRVCWADGLEQSILKSNLQLVKAPPASTWSAGEQVRREALRPLIIMEAWASGKSGRAGA